MSSSEVQIEVIRAVADVATIMPCRRQRQNRAALTAREGARKLHHVASADPPLMAAGANRPLAGITVLDFGQVYQGPYATLLMAKAGADVIKIEPPQGEPLRRRAPPGKSTTFPIAMLNSNKRAITLNLKHDRLALRLDPFRRGRGPPARDSRR